MTVEPIDDHAERALRRLPTQHDRASWRKLLRALLGIRGTWADDAILWAVRATTKGAIVFPEAQLATYFGVGGAATITGGGSTDFDLGSGQTLRVSALISPPAFTATPEVVDAALLAQSILGLTHDELDGQIVAEVTAALAGAPWGLQELEGVFFTLTGLRTLAASAGLQLDGIGDIEHLTRDGQSDADYRAALRLARRANRSHGTMPEVIDAAAEQDGVIFVQVQNDSEAYYTVYLHGTTLDARRRTLLKAMRASGIGTDVVSSGGTLPFVFGPDAGWNRILAVALDVFEVEGDVSGLYDVDDVVNVWDFAAQAYVHETTIVSVTFVGPNTNILVADGGGVTPGTIILENVDRGAQDLNGGPYDDAFEIVGFTGPDIFRVDNDATSQFVGGGVGVGHLIEVTGSTGDDGFYRVVAVSFAAGETSLQVTPTPPAGSGDGQLQHAAPERAPLLDAARSMHGEFADVFVD